MIRSNFRQILHILCNYDIDFVVVGALSAVLQGAPIMTLDIDIVHSRSIANIESLIRALKELEAVYRGHPGKKLVPTREHLSSAGHQLLMTKYGPFDLLGTIEHGLDYERLLGDAIELEVDNQSIRILSLAKYVELKQESEFPKDRARLPVLKEVLNLQNNQNNDQ